MGVGDVTDGSRVWAGLRIFVVLFWLEGAYVVGGTVWIGQAVSFLGSFIDVMFWLTCGIVGCRLSG